MNALLVAISSMALLSRFCMGMALWELTSLLSRFASDLIASCTRGSSERRVLSWATGALLALSHLRNEIFDAPWLRKFVALVNLMRCASMLEDAACAMVEVIATGTKVVNEADAVAVVDDADATELDVVSAVGLISAELSKSVTSVSTSSRKYLILQIIFTLDVTCLLMCVTPQAVRKMK